jgi:hypothetical protein
MALGLMALGLTALGLTALGRVEVKGGRVASSSRRVMPPAS